MFVANNMVNDRRVIREATTVAAAGFEVTVHAIRQRIDRLPDREEHPGGFTIVRHRFELLPPLLPISPRVIALCLHPFWCAFAVAAKLARNARLPLSGAPMLVVTWASWATLASRASSSAHILHAHDLLGALPALVALRARPEATLLYDSHEVFLESGRWVKAPAYVRRLLAKWIEQPALHRAAALIAVNPQVIEELESRYDVPSRRVVTYNCTTAWSPEPRDTELRSAIGVDAAAQVILYHGRFAAQRGLEELLIAILDPRLAAAHLVFLGYGPLEDMLRRTAAESKFAGRVHVLKAVAPEVLDRWISGADVGMCTILPSTLNHRISTPNKLFESIAAGVTVVGSDFAPIREILLGNPDGPLGAVCDPADPDSVATAISAILSLDSSERTALGVRCLNAVATEWNWDAQAEKLVALYQSIEPAPKAIK